MSRSDAEFLQRLNNQAEERQSSFIANISKRLQRPMPDQAPVHPFQGAPTFWQEHHLDPEQRIEQFMEHWKQAGGHASRFPNLEQALSYVAATARDMGARHFIRHRQPLLDQLAPEKTVDAESWTVWDGAHPEEMKTKAAGADIGLIVADYAVSTTGSLVSMSAPGKGRSVSLLPTALMAIVPADKVYTRLGEVMAVIRRIGLGNMPAGIHFISGPSRSADIENDLTIGVHGPGIVHALIVDDTIVSGLQ